MAWTAGLIVALHPTLVYAATHVQVATLGTTLLIWALAWAYQTGSSGRTRDAVDHRWATRSPGVDRPDPGPVDGRYRLGDRAGWSDDAR